MPIYSFAQFDFFNVAHPIFTFDVQEQHDHPKTEKT